MRRFAAVITSLAALCLAAAATSIVPMSIEELTTRANVIVEARALDQWSQWDKSEHLIYTYTRFAVTRSLKGATSQTIVVRQMGGTAGGYTQKVSGVRQWQNGEETVLFLRPSVANDGSLAVVGLMQGDFRISRASDGTATVTNGVPDVSALTRSGAATFTGSLMSLSALEQRVQGVK